MEAKHLVTLALGTAAAALAIAWAVREVRLDSRAKRYPLMRGPLSAGLFVTALLPFAALVPTLYAIFTLELVPKGSPGMFVAMLAWVSAATIASILALITRRSRREALGWLTLLGDDSLRIERAGESLTVTLRPASVRIYFLIDGPQYAQFELRDGEVTAHLWGMLAMRDFKLVTEGYNVPAQGLMVGGSTRALCELLAPYVTRD